MRICYFIGSYSPDLMGNAGHEEVIQELRRGGLDVEVLTLIAEPGAPRLSKVEYDGVPVYRINVGAKSGRVERSMRRASSRLLHYDNFMKVVRATSEFWREHHYDLIHAEAVYPYAAAAIISSGGKVPLLANVQGADVITLPDQDYGYRRFRLPRVLVGYTLRRARGVRVNSPYMVPFMAQIGADPGKVVMVPRSLEGTAFPPTGISLDDYRAGARERLAERYDLDGPEPGRPWIMSLSRLHPFKGLEFLVAALPLLVDQLRAAGKEEPRLWLCGPSRATESYGDYSEFLRAQARGLGVEHLLTFTGQVPHDLVRDHLAAADALASPSVIEALHRAALEAAAVGTPAVVSESTGAATYLAPYGACLTVPPRSPQALADAVATLILDADKRTTISTNARNLAETFRTPAVAARLRDVYEQLIGKER